MKPAKSFWTIIIFLGIIKFSLPFLLQSPVYELQRDEYLYYEQGQHLALGYLENPPMLSWLASVSSWFGGSEFWIKFWAALCGAGTLILTCQLAAEFGGRVFAQLIAGLTIIGGAFLRVHALFQPNVLDIFFWTLSLYYLVRYLNTNFKGYLYLVAISLALGLWSKYSIAFLALSLAIALLISKHRQLFAQRRTYQAVLVGLVLIFPNIWWQYEHRWPIIHHMKELQETQLQYLSPMSFIKDQFLMLLPAIFVWIPGLIWLFRQKKWRFLFFTFFLVIGLLIVGRGKSYYSLGIYPILLAAGGVFWETISLKRIWVRWAVTTQVLLFTIVLIPVLLPVWNPERLANVYQKRNLAKTGLLKWEDQRDHLLPQDFADMLGWKDLAAKTERFFNTLPDSTKQNTVVYCRNYGQAGALKYYGKEKNFTDKVFSDNGSFLLWIPQISFKHLLFVGRSQPGKDDLVFNHFQSVNLVDSVDNIYSRQSGDRIIFYSSADTEATKLANDGLAEKLKTFRR